MGAGVPAGIAANIVTGRTTFTIAGDGDFLMNGQVLATAVPHPCVDAMWMAAATQPRENALEIFRIIADTPEM